MPEIIIATQHVLDPDATEPTPDHTTDITHLWDPELGALPAGVNYGTDDDLTTPDEPD